MSILFLTNSILTTVQDLGRAGYRDAGINPSGVMDRTAARLINILLANDEHEAVLEIHFPGPKILFEDNASIALGGADFAARLDGQSIQNWATVAVRKGQVLSFSEKVNANRLYLAVKGGFRIKTWLGSRSTNLKAQRGGFEGRPLRKNDRLRFNLKQNRVGAAQELKISPYFVPKYSAFPEIRLIPGREFDFLTPLSSEELSRQSFQITGNSDRMGFRLRGEPLYLLEDREMLSSAVTFGTLQLLPSGQIIILMADHQTTGGYPRIGNVVSVDLSLVAQLGVNNRIRFETISLAEAEDLALNFERDLRFLSCGVKFRRGFC
jgi:antagonist of KipI